MQSQAVKKQPKIIKVNKQVNENMIKLEIQFVDTVTQADQL